MSETFTLDVPDEVAQRARSVAEQTGARIEDVLMTWFADSVTDQAVGRLIEDADAPEIPLSSQQQVELSALLNRREEELSDSEYMRLNELLRTYRQELVRKAQAITDWLTIGELTTADMQVTQLTRVRSTMLYAVGYDFQTQTLEVVFNSGGIYRYFDVPPHMYRDLLAAESKGRYMWTHIFDLYSYSRLRRPRTRSRRSANA